MELCYFIVFRDLLGDLSKIWKFAQFHQIKPSKILDPFLRFRFHGVQIESCATCKLSNIVDYCLDLRKCHKDEEVVSNLI